MRRLTSVLSLTSLLTAALFGAITDVAQGGFGERAGLQKGDLLLTLRGIRVHDTQQLWTILALTEQGSTEEATWARDRELMRAKAAF